MGNYLGRNLDRISNIEILDNITFDGSSSYSITKGSVAFTPNSAQSLLISIDGVVQATNFTVSSSTIDFGVAIPSTSVCNFFLHYGTGVMTVPSDGSVTTAKLGDNAVTTAKITDANVTSAKMFSGFKNGITEADQWRLSANLVNNSGVNDITANLERNDTDFALIGTGMTESSGVFTFPQTGIYLVTVLATVVNNATNQYGGIYINFTTDNSTYNNRAYPIGGGGSGGQYQTIAGNVIFDVTNTSTHKVKFQVSSPSSLTLQGGSGVQYTGFTFIRLGDT